MPSYHQILNSGQNPKISRTSGLDGKGMDSVTNSWEQTLRLARESFRINQVVFIP